MSGVYMNPFGKLCIFDGEYYQTEFKTYLIKDADFLRAIESMLLTFEYIGEP